MAMDPWDLPPPDIITRSGSWTLARVKVLPFPRLPLISISHELVVGGDVGEVIWMIEVGHRECLGLLVQGSMGHGIEVVHLWHLRLIVSCLKERNRVN